MKAILLGLWTLTISVSAIASAPEITAKARQNFVVIDALGVESHWPAGVHVDWKTGVPDGKPENSAGKHTHCSAFAAAAADALGIYLLHPPEHGQVLLANAQYDWLSSTTAVEQGWREVTEGAGAQTASNAGDFVLAVYKNRDPNVPGHIAVIRPSLRTADEISLDGPEVTQAGITNHLATTMAKGFADHPRALQEHLIRFFRHSVE